MLLSLPHQMGSIMVTLSTWCPDKDFQGGFAEVRVVDSGIGINATDLPRISTGSTRSTHQLARQYEGSGIGLALVKELVELRSWRYYCFKFAGRRHFLYHAPASRRRFSFTERDLTEVDHVTSANSIPVLKKSTMKPKNRTLNQRC